VKDPVTGTMRKKALFSMPALCDVSDGELEEVHYHNGDSKPKPVPQKQQQQPSTSPSVSLFFKSPRIPSRATKDEVPVQRILVVDRNEKIGSLFRRSLSNLFGSGCEIVTVQTAAEALKQYRNSDIVIAEERLYKPLKPVHSTSSMTPPPPPPLSHIIQPSGSVPAHLGDAQHMSGSELFAKIADDCEQKPCILIGVSTHPLQDQEHFYQAGADFVWGKPPPRMDVRLRGELVAALLAKRAAGAKEQP